MSSSPREISTLVLQHGFKVVSHGVKAVSGSQYHPRERVDHVVNKRLEMSGDYQYLSPVFVKIDQIRSDLN